MHCCDQSWIFSSIAPVFSVTWSFRKSSDLLLKKPFFNYYYYQYLKQLRIFFQDSLINRKFKDWMVWHIMASVTWFTIPFKSLESVSCFGGPTHLVYSVYREDRLWLPPVSVPYPHPETASKTQWQRSQTNSITFLCHRKSMEYSHTKS